MIARKKRNNIHAVRLTWNCAHLPNANKFEHIRHINTMLGFFVPTLTTPVELFNWEEGE